jgi:hypothetical protein
VLKQQYWAGRRLNPEICDRLAGITSQSFDILIGDANGADKALRPFSRTTTTKRSPCIARDPAAATMLAIGGPAMWKFLRDPEVGISTLRRID